MIVYRDKNDGHCVAVIMDDFALNTPYIVDESLHLCDLDKIAPINRKKIVHAIDEYESIGVWIG